MGVFDANAGLQVVRPVGTPGFTAICHPRAWKDTNTNGQIDEGEPWGYFDSGFSGAAILLGPSPDELSNQIVIELTGEGQPRPPAPFGILGAFLDDAGGNGLADRAVVYMDRPVDDSTFNPIIQIWSSCPWRASRLEPLYQAEYAGTCPMTPYWPSR